jgi:hypothetical protein
VCDDELGRKIDVRQRNQADSGQNDCRKGRPPNELISHCSTRSGLAFPETSNIQVRAKHCRACGRHLCRLPTQSGQRSHTAPHVAARHRVGAAVLSISEGPTTRYLVVNLHRTTVAAIEPLRRFGLPMEQLLEVGDDIERSLAEIQSAMIRGVFGVWEAKRGTRTVPLRKELTPRELRPYLPHLHLFDVKGTGHFKVRVCGTVIARAMGRDTTGAELTLDDPSTLTHRTARVLQRVLISQAPVFLCTRRGAAPGTRIHRAESVWLPLSDSGSAVDQILAATAIEVLPEFAQTAAMK